MADHVTYFYPGRTAENIQIIKPAPIGAGSFYALEARTRCHDPGGAFTPGPGKRPSAGRVAAENSEPGLGKGKPAHCGPVIFALYRSGAFNAILSDFILLWYCNPIGYLIAVQAATERPTAAPDTFCPPGSGNRGHPGRLDTPGGVGDPSMIRPGAWKRGGRRGRGGPWERPGEEI